jgi:hypothetical protein
MNQVSRHFLSSITLLAAVIGLVSAMRCGGSTF